MVLQSKDDVGRIISKNYSIKSFLASVSYQFLKDYLGCNKIYQLPESCVYDMIGFQK